MIMNSLCALALGFALDMIFGDPDRKYYPVRLVKRLVRNLEKMLRQAYADTPEAQNMAGVMLVVITLLITVGITVTVMIICYKINVVLGIDFEGLLCWFSLSGKYLSTDLQSVFRAAKAQNTESVHRNLKRFTYRDVEGLGLEDCIKCAIEEGAENTVDWVIGPIFWTMLLGGAGGFFCRVINIMDNEVGFRSEEFEHIGKVAAKLDDVVMFLPARLGALLMRLDTAFLKLDSKGAAEVYSRDRKKSPSPNSGHPMAVCAGALNIELGSDEYYGGRVLKKPRIGDSYRKAGADEIFWTQQLMIGSEAMVMITAVIVRVVVYIAYLGLIK